MIPIIYENLRSDPDRDPRSQKIAIGDLGIADPSYTGDSHWDQDQINDCHQDSNHKKSDCDLIMVADSGDDLIHCFGI